MPIAKVFKFGSAWAPAFILVALLGAASKAGAETASANEVEKEAPEQTLKQKSLDPTSNLKQFQVQNRFIPNTFDAGGYANILNVRMLYPIPKSQAFPRRQVWRLTFPIRTAPGGPTGLSDTRLLGLMISEKKDLGQGKWWRYGLGPVFVFPTATDEVLGSEKWQVGPTAGAILASEKWQAAIIIQNPISFAGASDRADVNRLIWQPILVYWLPKQWYLGIQGTPKTINWENDAAATIPLSARVGKVTKIGKRYINAFVEPEYTVVHDDGPTPEWSILLGFNFLFPL